MYKVTNHLSATETDSVVKRGTGSNPNSYVEFYCDYFMQYRIEEGDMFSWLPVPRRWAVTSPCNTKLVGWERPVSVLQATRNRILMGERKHSSSIRSGSKTCCGKAAWFSKEPDRQKNAFCCRLQVTEQSEILFQEFLSFWGSVFARWFKIPKAIWVLWFTLFNGRTTSRKSSGKLLRDCWITTCRGFSKGDKAEPCLYTWKFHSL